MADTRNDQQETGSSYVPASFEKRTAAWMGVAYAVMVLFIITFAIFTGGKELPGTFPLFLIPVSVALAVITVYRQRKGTAPGGLVTTVVVLICCALGVVVGLALGVPALAAALTDPMGSIGGLPL
jgi:4-hydroxybenzoate polyprenyltransferase